MKLLAASLFLGVLMCSLPCFSQGGGGGTPNYHLSQNYFLQDNIGNCTTQDCFVATAGTNTGATAVLKQISSGFDGYVLGLDLNGYFWKLPIATKTAKSTWTNVPAMGGGAVYVAVRTQSEVYALFPSSPCGTAYAIKQWNGSSWTTLNGCLSEISITQDGMLIGVNASNSTAYYTGKPVNPVSWCDTGRIVDSRGWN